MKNTLYLIMGISGSGKSTLANKLCDYVCEADQYFYDDKGNYNFNPKKLGQAHTECYINTKELLQKGHDVAVANTFLTVKERKKYIYLAEILSINLVVIECTGDYGNIHNVPEETIIRMKNCYQPFNRFKEMAM